LGLLAKGYMSRGELVPDSVVVDIVASRLMEADATGGALLDGFPRTVRQAELLVEWLGSRDRALGLVLSLEVDDAVVVGRLSGRRTCNGCGASYHIEANPPSQAGVCDRCGGEVVQRKDDAEETVLNRIQTYHRETSPVLGWLRERIPTHAIQADAPILVVQAQLEAAMASVQGA
jgi:adenylate kinase